MNEAIKEEELEVLKHWNEKNISRYYTVILIIFSIAAIIALASVVLLF